METSVYIKTYDKDKYFLEYLSLSIKKFLRGYKEIIVVSDNNFTFNNHGITHKFIVERPRAYLSGYNNQILTKLNAFKHVHNVERILILDSDMIITKEWDISEVHNWFFYRKWDEVGQAICWKPCMDKLFDIDSEFAFMVQPGWFYTRHLHNCLNRYIVTKMEKRNLEEAYKKLIKEKNLSEFEAMGHYLMYMDKLDYDLLPVELCEYPIKQFWTWSKNGIADYREEIESYLK